MPPATAVSAADMRSILDPLDALGMEDEYRREITDRAGGVTTAADVLGAQRGIDKDVLDGFEGEVFDDGQQLPGLPEGFAGKFYIPEDIKEGPLADAQNELGPASNHEKRIVFDCQGRRAEVQFAKLRHYLTKPCGETHHRHRAFYATLDQAVKYAGAPRPAIPDIPCRIAPKCVKLFDSEAKRDAHFRNRHMISFREAEDARRIAVENMTLETNRGMLAVLQSLTGQKGAAIQQAPARGEAVVVTSDEDEEEEADFGRTVATIPSRLPKAKKAAPKARKAPTLAPMPAGLPASGWKLYHVKEWLEANGHPQPESTFGMTLDRWIAYARQFAAED